jgi:uracil-DNA glycosylase
VQADGEEPARAGNRERRPLCGELAADLLDRLAIPVTRDAPPTALLTAVRESAPLMTKPRDRPAARLATPSAMKSWLASIS